MLDPDERKITLSLLGYPESSVGRLMTPDYIAVQKDWTIRQVIRHIRDVGKDSETIDVIYVVDEKGVFIDDIKIREIILADPDKKVEDVIDNRYIFLNVNDDQETAYHLFASLSYHDFTLSAAYSDRQLMLEADMASAPNSGRSMMPSHGYSTPAAMGMAITL